MKLKSMTDAFDQKRKRDQDQFVKEKLGDNRESTDLDEKNRTAQSFINPEEILSNKNMRGFPTIHS